MGSKLPGKNQYTQRDLERGKPLIYVNVNSKLAIEYYEPIVQFWTEEINDFNIELQRLYADSLEIDCRSLTPYRQDSCAKANENYNNLEKIYERICIKREKEPDEDACRSRWYIFRKPENIVIRKKLAPYINNIIKQNWGVEYNKYSKLSKKSFHLKAAQGFKSMLDKLPTFYDRKRQLIINQSDAPVERSLRSSCTSSKRWIEEQLKQLTNQQIDKNSNEVRILNDDLVRLKQYCQ